MPLIHGYTSPLAAEGLHPSDLGIRATEEAARSMGEAGRAIGQDIAQVGDTVDNANFARDTSALSSEYAQTRTQLTQATNDFFKNADPNDPELAAKYHEKVLQPALDGFGQGAISKRGTALAQKWRSDMSLDFGQTAVADQGIVAHGAVIANLENARHALTDSAYADPTTHDANQRAWGEVVEAQIASHQLNAEQAAALRSTEGEAGHKAIAVAAGRSMAERNPTQATADFDSGKLGGYLDGEEVSVLKGYAREQNNAALVAQRAQEAEQRKQEDDQFNGGMANLYAGMETPNGSMAVPPDYPQQLVKMALMPGAQRHPAEIKSAMEMIQRINSDVRDGKTIVTDPHTYADFSARMTLHDSDPSALTYSEVNTARAHGLLSDRDHSMFRQSIADNQKDPVKRDAYSQFGKLLTANKGVITHSNILSGVVDSPGDQRFAEYLRYERNQFDQHYRDNTWRKWLDDNSPTKDAVKFGPGFNPNQDMSKPAPYMAPPQMGGAAPTKRNPDESPDQYLKRIGKE